MHLNDLMINERETVKGALKKLDKTAQRVLLIVGKEQRFLGTVTDGDIRRHVLKGMSLSDSIDKVYNKNPYFIKKSKFSLDAARQILLEKEIELLPILDEENKVVNFTTWNQAFSEAEGKKPYKNNVDIPVVIMAGGKGTRLNPFNNIFPKPLIPIGEKPVIEVIMDQFKQQGAKKYYLTVNYKGEMIKSYFDNMDNGYEIEYVWEKDFRGTAGSLKLLEKNLTSNEFIVSNCDVIVKAGFSDVLEFHREKKAALTVLSSIQHHEIPYGVIKLKTDGCISEIVEKPEYTFMINAGVYILNKKVLDFIPNEKKFDMTDLIELLLENGETVLTYPVNESDYVDIGQWGEYKKAVEHFREVGLI